MDANSEFAVTALSEGSRVPSILFGVCSTLPYPTVDIGHVGFVAGDIRMLTWSLQYTGLSKGPISHIIGLVELE